MDNRPGFQCETVHPTMKVPCVRTTVEYYRDKLGFEIEFLWGDPPVHASVRLGQVSVHFSSDAPNPDGFWTYFVVDNVDGLFEWYQDNGVEILDEPEAYPWGMREFNIKDFNGYHLRFGQHNFRSGPPVKVERVDVQARIEKKLASIMADLAEHKGMTVGEMLEETLLHSFEAMAGLKGQGVASPHTERTLEFIAKLKEKHGLDYDTHDSYRFSEE